MKKELRVVREICIHIERIYSPYFLVNLPSVLPLVSGPVISSSWLSVQKMAEYTKSTTAKNFIQKQRCEAVTLEGSSGTRVSAKRKSTRLLSRVFFFECRMRSNWVMGQTGGWIAVLIARLVLQTLPLPGHDLFCDASDFNCMHTQAWIGIRFDYFPKSSLKEHGLLWYAWTPKWSSLGCQPASPLVLGMLWDVLITKGQKFLGSYMSECPGCFVQRRVSMQLCADEGPRMLWQSCIAQDNTAVIPTLACLS